MEKWWHNDKHHHIWVDVSELKVLACVLSCLVFTAISGHVIFFVTDSTLPLQHRPVGSIRWQRLKGRENVKTKGPWKLLLNTFEVRLHQSKCKIGQDAAQSQLDHLIQKAAMGHCKYQLPFNVTTIRLNNRSKDKEKEQNKWLIKDSVATWQVPLAVKHQST